MNIHSHKVKKFKNCPNPDCSSHYTPGQFDAKFVLENIKNLTSEKQLMGCARCDWVWYERDSGDSRTYYIIRNFANQWLENPWVERYILPKRRKV